MDFHFEKTTPANTAKKDFKRMKLKLSEGIIKQVWLFHPNGCAGLAHATINLGKHQLYPTNPEADYHGEGHPMIIPDNYELIAPAILSLHTWNDDDTYPHTVYIRITVIRERIEPWQQALIDLIAIMKELVGIS